LIEHLPPIEGGAGAGAEDLVGTVVLPMIRLVHPPVPGGAAPRYTDPGGVDRAIRKKHLCGAHPRAGVGVHSAPETLHEMGVSPCVVVQGEDVLPPGGTDTGVRPPGKPQVLPVPDDPDLRIVPLDKLHAPVG